MIATEIEKAAALPTERACYGGFWIRFAAFAIDAVLLTGPALIVGALQNVVGFFWGYFVPNQPEAVFWLWNSTTNCAIEWIYYAVLWSSPWQASVGKKICGLRVVDQNGSRISFGRATGRYFAGFLSAIILGIGFIMIAWTRRRQGLHDMIAETLVVKVGGQNRSSR